MPQDIPLEASEVLAFTPASLAKFDGAPVFRLRASTTRDKRFHHRLLVEEGVTFYDQKQIRAEVLKGLKVMWDEKTFQKQAPMVKDLWDARDNYEMQLKDDPSLKWDYDPELENAVNELVEDVNQSWPKLRRMLAANYHYNSISGPMIVAVTVKSVSNLDVQIRLERGYLTVASADAIEEALDAFERKHGIEEGVAWAELTLACSRRMYLTETERGNSASQSPSPTAPAPLSETNTSGKDGKSPELELSSETPETE